MKEMARFRNHFEVQHSVALLKLVLPEYFPEFGKDLSVNDLRELALAISVTSLGSSQILRCPHFKTAAAKRF
jgi:hypothetical protein